MPTTCLFLRLLFNARYCLLCQHGVSCFSPRVAEGENCNCKIVGSHGRAASNNILVNTMSMSVTIGKEALSDLNSVLEFVVCGKARNRQVFPVIPREMCKLVAGSDLRQVRVDRVKSDVFILPRGNSFSSDPIEPLTSLPSDLTTVVLLPRR